MKKVYPEHISIRTQPKNINKNDLSLFEHELLKTINATTIAQFKNVDILSNIIFSRYKLRFYEKNTNLYPLSMKEKLKKLRLFLSSYEIIDKGVWITDNASMGYFHWLTDAMPRLIVSENLMDSHVVLLPKKYEQEHFIKQSLEMLNFKIKFFSPTKRLHVKKLLLPSYTAPTGNYNKEIIRLVRDKFMIKNDLVPNKKIYISRQKANYRKITNESKVIALLESYDYEIHFFEDYDFEKQLNLMQKTTHLIGLHGAGLTNMLFMSNNSKVLELRNNDDYHNNCYFSLASDLDHDYYYLLNDGDSRDTAYVNVNVNLAKLKMTLEQMNL